MDSERRKSELDKKIQILKALSRRHELKKELESLESKGLKESTKKEKARKDELDDKLDILLKNFLLTILSNDIIQEYPEFKGLRAQLVEEQANRQKLKEESIEKDELKGLLPVKIENDVNQNYQEVEIFNGGLFVEEQANHQKLKEELIEKDELDKVNELLKDMLPVKIENDDVKQNYQEFVILKGGLFVEEQADSRNLIEINKLKTELAKTKVSLYLEKRKRLEVERKLGEEIKETDQIKQLKKAQNSLKQNKEVNNVNNSLKQKEDLLKEENSNEEKLQIEVNELKNSLARKEKEIEQLETRLKNYQSISTSIKQTEKELEKKRNEYISGMGLKIFNITGKEKEKEEIEDKLDTFLGATDELTRRPGNDFVIGEKKKAKDYLNKKPGYQNHRKLTDLEKKQEELAKLEMLLEGSQDENELKGSQDENELKGSQDENELKGSQDENEFKNQITQISSKENKNDNKAIVPKYEKKEFAATFGISPIPAIGVPPVGLGVTYKSEIQN
ncbi:6740_t:CDS:1 [Scutellospora calospora]|uniref:6740_t:CDS:1 n=1 Tax=Scutellospora calospora TaxID=85575 RepID=A0ACA9JWS8_9GLOM|nr:6740_t:CDS:1 [Scutellospora calospora]